MAGHQLRVRRSAPPASSHPSRWLSWPARPSCTRWFIRATSRPRPHAGWPISCVAGTWRVASPVCDRPALRGDIDHTITYTEVDPHLHRSW